MAVEESEAFHPGHEIRRDLAETLNQDNVLDDAGGRFAVNIRQLEAVAVQMDRMGVVGLIVEDEAIALSFVKRARRVVFVELLAIDGPAIETGGAAVDFSDGERNGFDGRGGGAGVAEDGVVPGLRGGLIQRGTPVRPAYSTTMPMPSRRSSSCGVPRTQTPGFFISTMAEMRSAVPSESRSTYWGLGTGLPSRATIWN